MHWVLEVVRFITDKSEWEEKGTKFEHVGYMRSHFRTKNEAAAYYDRHNPHMRRLNAHNKWKSDWDPDTKLLYIVRKNHMIYPTITPFDLNNDGPIVNHG